MTLLDQAINLHTQGIASVPCNQEKRALVSWKACETALPEIGKVKEWFGKTNPSSVALIAGEVQCIDFDEKYKRGLLKDYSKRAEEVGLDQVLGQCLIQSTPSGGFHLVFRCEGKRIRNVKLASRLPTTQEQRDNPQQKNCTLIETRGEGGYFLIHPSPGYDLLQGSFDDIPTLEEEDRDALLDLARSFDEMPKADAARQPTPSPASELSPGDDYDAKADVPALLRKHGWTSADRQGKYWTRPGKKKGISASWNVVPNRLFVFTSNSQFEPNHSYRPWAAYAVLEHGGDFSAAAADLRRQGFGSARKPAPAAPAAQEDEAPEDERGMQWGGLRDEGLADEKPGVSRWMRPMTVWKPSQFFSFVPDPEGDIVKGGYLAKGEWTSLLGVGGLGKSRMALWFSICQMVGRDWCGLEMIGQPKKSLFLSTENGVVRWKHDLEKMWSVLEPHEREIVEENLYILALTPEEEGDLNLGTTANVDRLISTLQAFTPQVLILDPFADMIAGDENSTSDLVNSLRILRKVHRSGAPEAAVMIIHHARTGAANVAQAGDNYNSGNFGRGSKALYSRVRCELQLAPGDRNDSNRLVLACGKSNNGPKFEPRGVLFDPETFTYSLDPAFDLNNWRADVQGQAKGQACTISDVVQAVRELQKTAADEAKTKDILGLVSDRSGASTRTIKARLKDATRERYLSCTKQGFYRLGVKPLKTNE